MRIRKNASKLLGSASVHANPWPSPAMAAAPAEPEGLIICELNCSPWDVMLINNPDSNSCCSSFLTNPKEEEQDGGILGNSLKTKEEEPISAITSTAAELTLKEIKEIEDNKRVKKERRKSKGKEKATAETITYCKKSDGKGWHCKRPAQLPHSFCSYHLAQIRAYSYNHTHKSAADSSAADDGKSHQTKAAETAAAGGGSNFYYYYCGFGPWRGKRRGRAGGTAGGSAEVKGEEREDNTVAGDDEYDLDCFDDEDNGNYCGHRSDQENGKKREWELESKKMIKKRGRKPLKSRSLKSLL